MKRYDVHDDKVSPQLQNQRRRWALETKQMERKERIEKTYYDAKYGKIDKRPMEMALRKAEYERRNHAL
jgi:hypothetical protein